MPIPPSPRQDPNLVALGKRLFEEPRLSKDDSVSCATCHPLDRAGVDGLPVSVGIEGKAGEVNSPTVYNSGLLFAMFWDGRVETLEEQVEHPIQSPVEMGANWGLVLQKLREDRSYRMAFAALFSDGISKQNIVTAIAAFERSLNTPDGRFDRYLKGEDAALDETEKRGYQLFKAYGCSSCHQGVAVGGNMFQKMGVARDYFKDRGNLTKADYGRYNVTGDELSKFEFKVPSLRNVALTAPYFHDAQAKSLEQAIQIMGRYQIGEEIPDDEVSAIAAFLRSLTGKELE